MVTFWFHDTLKLKFWLHFGYKFGFTAQAFKGAGLPSFVTKKPKYRVKGKTVIK